MSSVSKVSIALSSELNTLVQVVAGSGASASTSEVVREALRDLDHKQEEQRAAIAKYRRIVNAGIDSGPGQFGPMKGIIAEAKGGFTKARKSGWACASSSRATL